MKCDIFISYRRDGGDMTAMYIYQALKERGYNVFYDLEVLRAGKFNDALLENIRACKDFVLILSPHALDRCGDENDWVRKEIAEALRQKKNIIPVMLNGFTFPEYLPDEIDDVRYQNGLTATTEYFMESVNRLCSRYLDSKPHKKGNPALIAAVAVAVAALALAAGMGWYFMAGPGSVPRALPTATPTIEPTETPTAEPTATPTAEPTATPTVEPTPTPMAVLSGTNLPELRGDPLQRSYILANQFENMPVLGNDEFRREHIRSVEFLPTFENMSENAWDVSAIQDSSVMAWAVPNGDLYDLYIAGEGGVKLHADVTELFSGYMNMKSIAFNGCVDFSGVENMDCMLEYCRSLEHVDLRGIDTSNVTNMRGLFFNCSGLVSVNLEGLDTSSVENMEIMFAHCVSLRELKLPERFVSASVENTTHMFYRCEDIDELDVSGWDVSGVKYMQGMFKECRYLHELDVANWDVSSAEDMSWMFSCCNQLDTLDMRDWNVSNVRDFALMFEECSVLRELDLSGWDTSSAVTMEGMFERSGALETLVLPERFVTGTLESARAIFNGCGGLVEIDVSQWDTSSVADMTALFGNCCSLQALDVSGWNTSSVLYMGQMFQNCEQLKTLDISNWDMDQVVDPEDMFLGAGITREEAMRQ